VVNREDLAFEAGWRAGYERGSVRPYRDLKAGDQALTADWEAYKREIAEPLRCVDCSTMIMAGARCEACRRIDDRGIE